MANIEDSILAAKDKLPNITPTPAGLKAQSSAHDLKARLEWGEPGLTIIDVRDREAFNHEHITGAVWIQHDLLAPQASTSIDLSRDIYVYAEGDQQTAQAAEALRKVGFQKVAELQGGLPAWKEIAAPTDGIASMEGPSGPSAIKSEEVNVAARLASHAQTQSKSH